MPGLTALRSNIIPLLGLLGVVIAIVAVLFFAFRKKPDPPTDHDDTAAAHTYTGPIDINMHFNLGDEMRLGGVTCPESGRLLVDLAQFTNEDGGMCIGQHCAGITRSLTPPPEQQ